MRAQPYASTVIARVRRAGPPDAQAPPGAGIDSDWSAPVAESELLTAAESAERLKLKPETVRGLVRRGELRAIRLGSGPKPPLRIRSEELERFLTAGETHTHELREVA
jgi:excisionase family DNA binding protein